MTHSVDTNTKLSQPWLTYARVTWILLSVAAFISFVASMVIAWNEPLPTCTTPDAVCGPWQVSQEDIGLANQAGQPGAFLQGIFLASRVVPLASFFIVGLVIFARRSDDWSALLLSLMLTLWPVEGIQNLGVFMPLVNILYAIVNSIFAVFPFVFPNGRFVPRWTRWLAVPLVLMWFPISFPTYFPALGSETANLIFSVYLPVTGTFWFFVAGYAAIYRYVRVSTPSERQQTKWVIAALLGSVIVLPGFVFVEMVFPPSQPGLARLAFMYWVYLPLTALSYLLLSSGIAFAILRYRLYDIDLIIRRTVTYSIITALLLGVYFGMVVLTQQLLRAVTGQNSELAIIVSTLAIAVLFNPLRKRVQDTIDKRFYRRKYDAQQVLAQFAQTARDETDIEKLTSELMRVVDETMQPEQVEVWLKKTGERSPKGRM